MFKEQYLKLEIILVWDFDNWFWVLFKVNLLKLQLRN